MNTNVLTMTQARQITGGRKPHVPVEYEQACKFLDQCIDLDDAKYWSDKSDALAAWAKIYHDDKVAVSAKRLKLKAYRRMGELAAQLRPRKGPFKNGPVSLLLEKGLTEESAVAARRLAIIPKKRFDAILSVPNPPSPASARRISCCDLSDEWKLLITSHADAFRSFCRRTDPKKLARSFPLEDVPRARALAVDIQEWVDTFEQYLPKEK